MTDDQIEVPAHQRKPLAQAVTEAKGRIVIGTVHTDSGVWLQVIVPEDEYVINIDPHGKVSSD